MQPLIVLCLVLGWLGSQVSAGNVLRIFERPFFHGHRASVSKDQCKDLKYAYVPHQRPAHMSASALTRDYREFTLGVQSLKLPEEEGISCYFYGEPGCSGAPYRAYTTSRQDIQEYAGSLLCVTSTTST
ncbi:unnamed protein product [Clonostachys chloroleuca]|uniref:Uncharacterized protein n=1 Tax=Clonostachys chloroleuca TaxID=1926264 RepID=A0AA35PTH9_9HYPO|nr:unnamed protein product [Clonostachys chloroleuca]